MKLPRKHCRIHCFTDGYFESSTILISEPSSARCRFSLEVAFGFKKQPVSVRGLLYARAAETGLCMGGTLLIGRGLLYVSVLTSACSQIALRSLHDHMKVMTG